MDTKFCLSINNLNLLLLGRSLLIPCLVFHFAYFLFFPMYENVNICGFVLPAIPLPSFKEMADSSSSTLDVIRKITSTG